MKPEQAGYSGRLNYQNFYSHNYPIIRHALHHYRNVSLYHSYYLVVQPITLREQKVV